MGKQTRITGEFAVFTDVRGSFDAEHNPTWIHAIDRSACQLHSDAAITYKDKRIAELEARLWKYSGWPPEQFLGILNEHRALQQKYIGLDAENTALRLQVEAFKNALISIRDTDPLDLYIWEQYTKKLARETLQAALA